MNWCNLSDDLAMKEKENKFEKKIQMKGPIFHLVIPIDVRFKNFDQIWKDWWLGPVIC